jgi:flagellar biosynthetic protein FliP
MLTRITSRRTNWNAGILALAFASVLLILSAGTAAAQASTGTTISAPGINLELGGGGSNNATALKFFLLLTILSLAPAILMMVTSFVRISIVLSFVRTAMGTQQMPPNQVIVGLALFLSLFVMAPTWQRINTDALQPYLNNQLPADQAFDRGTQPLRDFMFKQVREGDLGLFIHVGGLPRPNTQADVPTYALVPAFMISELKTAFQMGFLVMVPFLVIDIVVSSVLMSMGMMMLPPASISLPFKLLLFVMADGWHLIVHSLITSFA